MLNILSSPAGKESGLFKESPRRKEERNVAWLTRHLQGGGDGTSLLLLGGTDSYAFRMRVAQSHVRHDMSPSRWSHIGILGPLRKNPAATKVHEISLQPRRGFGFPAATNGVQDQARVRDYDDPEAFPNVAVLRIPAAWKDVSKALEQFKKQRAVLDAKELILHWLAFTWGVGRSGNPLLDGHGIPSAAMVETVVGAAGYDLTPGLESGASCPEAIWQAARWWHEYYSEQKSVPIAGSFTADHRIG